MNKLLVGLLVSALAIAVGVFAYLYLLGGNRSDAPVQVSQPPATQQPKPAPQNQPPAAAPAPAPAPPPTAPQQPAANPLPPGLVGMDSNGDGAIDLAEFLTFRMRVFDALDINKDGLLVKDEFLKLAEPPYVPADSAAPTPDAPKLPPLAERQKFLAADFDRIDTNKDGKISKQEAQIQFTFDFQRADINGDGKLDAADVAPPRRVSRQEFIDTELKRFDGANTARNGKLTFAEFVIAAKQLNQNPPGSSPAEFDQMLASQFGQMDADKDKIVTRQEYTDFASARFAVLDRDHDGFLTDADATAPQSVTRKDFLDLEMRRFEAADKNKDGKVSADEYAAWVRTETELPPNLTAEQFRKIVDQQFKEMDIKKKGVVTREEYQAFVTKRFDDLDRDKNGILTEEEMPAGPPRDNINKADFIALETRRFMTADADKDGVLTLDEFLSTALKAADRPATITDDQMRKVATERFKEIDANNDGKITKEEIATFVAKRFDQLDRDKNGILTANELNAGPDKIGKADYQALEVNRYMSADANGDGIVTLDEFLAVALKAKDRPTGWSDEQMRKAATERFKDVDANKDNKLTKEEIAASAGKRFDALDANKDGFLTPEEAAPKQRDWVSLEEFIAIEMRTFDQFDRNKDGKIALEEMLTSVPTTLTAERQEEAKAGITFRFNQLDTNKDGFVSREEFAASIRALFKQLDANNDGRLTPAEYNRQAAPPPGAVNRPPAGPQKPGAAPPPRPAGAGGTAPPPPIGGQPPLIIMPPPTPIR